MNKSSKTKELAEYLDKRGLSYAQFWARRKAFFFYDEDVDKLNQDIDSYNNGAIIICRKCRKVDVHPIYHATECDPQGEYERQQAQNVYWN